ncbi:hypothetical protein VHEMI07896 [[Torrubiella] hemipterigena]|uniref:NmrA-like domain-containing protein n=1 Tax=[Torrubiella] hemipterigena TaxID=1531966 RepID=A0A0A1TM91_9HYPO|nr:hypothetical protein VHEMI07896 [[Torrubiella] hemipterigena]
MAITAQGRNVAIIGASGQVGRPLIATLLNSGVHTITALQRPDATSSFPTGVTVITGDLANQEFLESSLKGQDALVLMPPLSHLEALQEPAIRAAAKVSVPYILPSEFGPDPFATDLIRENGLLQAKKRVRDLIEQLGVSSWVSIAVGPWVDFGLGPGLWGIDTKAKTARVWKGANGRVSTASIQHTGEAVGAVLGLPDEELAKLKNKAVYAASFHISQRDLWKATVEAMGSREDEWTVLERDVRDVEAEYEEGIARGDEQAPYVKFYVQHFLDGRGGDFENKTDERLLAMLYDWD